MTIDENTAFDVEGIINCSVFLAGCQQSCPLDVFILLTQNSVPVDWHRECMRRDFIAVLIGNRVLPLINLSK